MSQARKFLEDAAHTVHESFVADRTILSFDEYLELLWNDPVRQLRDSACYLRDVFDFGGTEQVRTPLGEHRRFCLFDAATDGDAVPLFGQEGAQEAAYRHLNGFVQLGRVNRLILLHGPNGSGKSTLVNLLVRAMENYSHTPEGALYRFHWILPNERRMRSGIGFGQRGRNDSAESAEVVLGIHSYARMRGEELDARIRCDMKDHPLLLLRPEERQHLVAELKGAERLPEDFELPNYLARGDLCHKCREIHDALLATYDGDYLQVLAHAQVERFYISRRYRRGAVTVEPQLGVDADVRQVTADQSLHRLPAPLSHTPLLEVLGDLVDANRGIIEFSDILKRPPQSYKYLLTSIETQRVNLGACLVYLDMVLVASTNDAQLFEFKASPEFASFKGRMELVRVPYLLRCGDERRLYEKQLEPAALRKHLSPNVGRVAALWAVLTRMRKPEKDAFTPDVRTLVDGLTPLEKARLYDRGETPRRLSSGQAKLLLANLRTVHDEGVQRLDYEGAIGASAREMSTVLLAAAQSAEHSCVSVPALLKELERLVQDRTLFPFLRQEVLGSYYDNAKFIDLARQEWLDIVDEEVRTSSGLVEDAQHIELLHRYLRQVSAWLKKDKILDTVTGQLIPPDEAFMKRVESAVAPQGEDVKDVRQSLVSRVANFSVSHPGAVLDLEQVFAAELTRLKSDFYEQHKKRLARLLKSFLELTSDPDKELSTPELREAARFRETFLSARGYCRSCGAEAVGYLLRHRYEA
ncbi:MAG: serine protein kinase PrkA [Candidatus Schekmanbacteria bacterium]|nr:serine protein kinase PrkA [Candidatus Schekmanbacteria bacterium]